MPGLLLSSRKDTEALMHVYHSNIGLPVFGGEVRPEPRSAARLTNPVFGTFGGEVRPKVRAVTMRT